MNDEVKPTGDELEVPQRKAPICPHCLHDPFRPQGIPFNVENGVQLLIFYCEDCRKTINAVILAMPQPRVMPALPSPRIIRPQ